MITNIIFIVSTIQNLQHHNKWIFIVLAVDWLQKVKIGFTSKPRIHKQGQCQAGPKLTKGQNHFSQITFELDPCFLELHLPFIWLLWRRTVCVRWHQTRFERRHWSVPGNTERKTKQQDWKFCSELQLHCFCISLFVASFARVVVNYIDLDVGIAVLWLDRMKSRDSASSAIPNIRGIFWFWFDNWNIAPSLMLLRKYFITWSKLRL